MISVLSEAYNVHAVGIFLHDTVFFKNILATIDFCHQRPFRESNKMNSNSYIEAKREIVTKKIVVNISCLLGELRF